MTEDIKLYETAIRLLETILDDQETMEKICRQIFNDIDNDGNGSLEIDEIKDFIFKVAEEHKTKKPSERELSEVFDKLDDDGSGDVDP